MLIMFGKRLRIFSLFGFEVRIDASWLVIMTLVAWSLAAGYFPSRFADAHLSTSTFWLMGIFGGLGLFASIIFHELCHSLVARAYGIPMKGITLFIFGGVAEMGDEPRSPKAEFLMAIAGPVASVALSFGFLGTNYVGVHSGWPIPLVGVLGYLGFINLLLAAFNMVPAFPLDGGRVLRAVLWSWRKNLRWATRMSSQIGSAFATGLIVLGILRILLASDLISGFWFLLIGLFLRNAARMSYSQMIMRRGLEGEPVSRFMTATPVTVPRGVSVAQLVADFIYRYHFKMFPVMDNGQLLGCVTIQQVKEMPHEEWDRHVVGEITSPVSPENAIRPDADAMEALSAMNRTGESRLMVVDEGRLLGIVSLKDLLKFLSLKVELEGE